MVNILYVYNSVFVIIPESAVYLPYFSLLVMGIVQVTICLNLNMIGFNKCFFNSYVY